MKIIVFGTGGVGGYVGGRFAQAGMDVYFVARGRHLDAMRTHGLKVESIRGDFAVNPIHAVENAKTIGTADVVLCCVKSWQVGEAAESIRPVLGPRIFIRHCGKN